MYRGAYATTKIYINYQKSNSLIKKITEVRQIYADCSKRLRSALPKEIRRLIKKEGGKSY